MKLDELQNYRSDRMNSGLTKLSAEFTVSDADSNVYITKRKETYELEGEGDADQLIEAATHDNSCVGHDKKFKQGKVNKQGEEIRPDRFVVTLKYNLR